MLAVGKDTFYTVVNSRDKYWWLFRSKDKGRTWQKVGQGLPEEEKFILLEVSAGSLDIVALATTTGVYLSTDGGARFSYLGSPYGLAERKEEITSLTLAGASSILLGVRHPSLGKFSQEGVYLWQGKNWEPQGLWQKDVNAVAFLEGYILALSSDNTGTFLNIAYPGQRTVWGIKWNELPGWSIEVSQVAGQSPKESELLNARLALSEFDWREGKIYVVFNTVQKTKDDVYLVSLNEGLKPNGVRRLGIATRAYNFLGLDSLAYTGTFYSGTLVVGVTTEERGQRRAMVYYLTAAEERYSPPDWQVKWGVFDTQNCQVAIVGGTIFAATSGKASSFARSEPVTSQRDILISISLIDASGIELLAPSPNFLQDRTIYLTCGRNILKIILGADYKLVEAQRLLYFSQPVTFLRIDPQSQSIFVFVSGEKFWVTENFGLSWAQKSAGWGIEIVDGAAVSDKLVYVIGKDSMVYCLNSSWDRLASGIRFVRKVEAGPDGKALVAGSVKETDTVFLFDTLSLVGGTPVTVPLPGSGRYQYLEFLYAPQENLIYCGVNKELYTNVSSLDGEWQKVADFSWPLKKLFFSPQGLYALTFSGAETRFYFMPFPLKDSQPIRVGEPKGEWLGYKLVELNERQNLLILWDYSRVTVWAHDAAAVAEAQTKAKAEAEAKAKAKAEAEAKAKAEAEAKAKVEAEVKPEPSKPVLPAPSVPPVPVVPPVPPTRETGFPEGAVVPILAFFGGIAWIIVKLVRYARNKLRP